MSTQGRPTRFTVLAFIAAAALVVALLPAGPASATPGFGTSGHQGGSGTPGHGSGGKTPGHGSTPKQGSHGGKTKAGKSASGKTGKAKKTADKRYVRAGCGTLTGKQRRSTTPYAHCMAMGYGNSNGHLITKADGPPETALGPDQIQDAYNLPNEGEGQTIAIVDSGGYKNAESDLAKFRDHYGLPECSSDDGCFTKLNQNGGTDYPAEDPDWSTETALDLDAISAACPKCKLLLVEGDSASLDDLGTATDTAADQDGVAAISNSYGVEGEDSDETDYDHYYDHSGIAVTASSGDTGDVTNWPATSPKVAGIGGTTLKQNDSDRGWKESVWGSESGGDGAGSGCSKYEPRPDYQKDIAALDKNCSDNKAIADISADADPATGLAIYNTSGQSGWAQYGGTSLSAPLTAAMYGLAGTPTPDTYPVQYPYDTKPAHLNDVTDGANGSCGNVLCEAGKGWDGPTGLGTPDGVQALAQGETGTIKGTVTDNANDAVKDAKITATDSEDTDFTATTGKDGTYSLDAPEGTYAVKASKFGYKSKTNKDVKVTKNKSVTKDFSVTKASTETVTGTVTDGSGHGWPMRSKITIDGDPNGAVYSDPYTGHYELKLPKGDKYTMHVKSADLGGYQTKKTTVDLTSGGMIASPPHQKYAPPNDRPGDVSKHNKKAKPAAAHKNIALKVDDTCTAPGYKWHYDGTNTDFTGWKDKTPKGDWTVTDKKDNKQTWAFDDPGDLGNLTGGSGNFAVVDSDDYGAGDSQDTSLVSPVTDLSDQDHPKVEFDTDYATFQDESTAKVDLSTDGGDSWSNVWKKTKDDKNGHVSVAIPDAAGKSKVQVRFHYTGSFAYHWELDNVSIGKRSCKATDGGLVAGIVRDFNTHKPVNGAKVQSDVHSSEAGTTKATPDDPGLTDGYYWLFSSHTGQTKFNVSKSDYKSHNVVVNVPTDYAAHKNFVMRAGHLGVDKKSLSVSEELGASKSKDVKFTNDGTEPVHVKLNEQAGGFDPMNGAKAQSKTPVHKQKVQAKNPAAKHKPHAKSGKAGNQLRKPTPSAGEWNDIGDYPTPISDNATAYHDGKAYSVGGFDGSDDTKKSNVYNPNQKEWKSIADAPVTTEEAGAAFVGQKMYLVGGWVGDSTSKATYAYDPGNDKWTKKADMPNAASAAGVASVNGKIYAVGGCDSTDCTSGSDAVYQYDPGSDGWSKVADFPDQVAYASCAGTSGKLVCAGGLDPATDQGSKATYTYDPGSDEWSKGADMPTDLWGSSVAGANDKMQVAMGISGDDVTNQAFEYDPSGDKWSDLPNANNTLFRGGGTCGMYQIGGQEPGLFPVVHADSAVLPGYDQCGAADVDWLSESKTKFDVDPGDSVTVKVTMDASKVSQPGDYTAKLAVNSDAPNSVDPIDVSMHVNPPSSWGKVAGTVTDGSGDPVSGATVQICTMYHGSTGMCGPQTYTLKTDNDGKYQLWLDKGYSPLQMIAAKDGYQPTSKIVKVHGGDTTTANFTMKKARSFTHKKVEKYMNKHTDKRAIK